MRILKFLSLTVLSLSSLSVAAEDLLAVFRLAQCNDPTIQAAKEAQLAAAEATPQARALFLPQLNATANQFSYHVTNNARGATPPLSGTINASSFGYNQGTYSLILNQPVFYYQQWVQYAQAEAQVKQANATYAAAEQDLIVRTIQGYFNVLKAMDALKFAKAQRLALAKYLEQTQARFKVGLIAITDVQIAKAQHDSAYAQEITAENNVANAKEKLREITGYPIEHFAHLREILTLKSPEPDNIEKWVCTAMEQNFNLQAARFKADAARTAIKINQGGHLPTVNINGSVNSYTRTPLSTNKRNVNAGLQVALPLFNGGAVVSKTKQAVHLYEQTQQQMETTHRQTESNTRQAYRSVLTQISQVNALKQAIISNESALKATQASFDVGTRTIVDVLSAQTNLIQAQQNHANARYDYIVQSVLLKQAAGLLEPCDVQHINAWLKD
jgi:outer membrane protein